MHVIKMGEKEENGHTKEDVEFCKELILSVDTIPAIREQAERIDVASCETQEDLKDCLDKMRGVIVYHTQLKCCQEEFGFNSVGAVKSKSHRYRKYMKEEFERKMIISEITENKMHRYNGDIEDKWEGTNITKTKCSFKYGTPHGTFKTFYKDGTKKTIKMYKDGKLDGDYREFYSNGKTKLTGQFSNNIKVGAWEAFREDGKIDEMYVISTNGNKMFELYGEDGNVQEVGTIRI
jgi:antitoxin component YwqK of YwqJK toxin-antitoxin module